MIPLGQGIDRLNRFPLDGSYEQDNILGVGLDDNDKPLKKTNNYNFYVGMPCFNKLDGKMYFISAEDSETYYVTCIGIPNTPANQTLLSKFTDIDGKLYYDGGELMLMSNLTTDTLIAVYAPDEGTGSFPYGDLNHADWATLASGVYRLSGLGTQFLNAPFSRTATKDYILTIYLTNSGGYHNMMVYVSSNDTMSSNGRIFHRIAFPNGWKEIYTKDKVQSLISETIGAIEITQHGHFASVLNIDHLLSYEIEEPYDGSTGYLFYKEFKPGKIVNVEHYDILSHNSITASRKSMMFIGSDYTENTTLDNWVEIVTGPLNIPDSPEDVGADPAGAAASAVSEHESTNDHSKLHAHSNTTELAKIGEDAGKPTYDSNRLALYSEIATETIVGPKITVNPASAVITIPFYEGTSMKSTITEDTTLEFSDLTGNEGAIIEHIVSGLDNFVLTLPTYVAVVSGQVSSARCRFVFTLYTEASGSEEVFCDITPI